MPFRHLRVAMLAVAVCLVSVAALAFPNPARAQYSNLVARHDFKCLDVSGISLANAAAVHQWECLGPTRHNQQWAFRPVGEVTYRLWPATAASASTSRASQSPTAHAFTSGPAAASAIRISTGW